MRNSNNEILFTIAVIMKKLMILNNLFIIYCVIRGKCRDLIQTDAKPVASSTGNSRTQKCYISRLKLVKKKLSTTISANAKAFSSLHLFSFSFCVSPSPYIFMQIIGNFHKVSMFGINFWINYKKGLHSVTPETMRIKIYKLFLNSRILATKQKKRNGKYSESLYAVTWSTCHNTIKKECHASSLHRLANGGVTKRLHNPATPGFPALVLTTLNFCLCDCQNLSRECRPYDDACFLTFLRRIVFYVHILLI